MDEGAACFRRFLAGEEEAFDELLDRYQKSLLCFLLRYVKIPAVAEDLAADVFAQLIARPEQYNFSVSLKTYLFLLGRSRAIDYLRRESRFQKRPVEEADTEEAGQLLEETLLRNERARQVNAALAELSPDYRRVLHLLYFEDLSTAEAAKVLGKSTKQVENLAYRSKKALRKILGEEGRLLL